MEKFKVALFANGVAGSRIAGFLLKNHKDDLGLICVPDRDSAIIDQCTGLGFDSEKIVVYDTIKSDISYLKSINFQYFILVYWPDILDVSVFSIPKIGTLNFHPALLPFNRGAHPAFWNIIEEAPFGVTIHFVDENIDSGDIVFQKELPKSWEDTGITLYNKSLDAIVNLFIENYQTIKNCTFQRRKQSKGGSLHYKKDIHKNLEIALDRKYTARELFNLLRAKKYPESPQCYFYFNNEKYSVEVTITKDNTKYTPPPPIRGG